MVHRIKEELKTIHPSGKSVTFTTARLQTTDEKVGSGRQMCGQLSRGMAEEGRDSGQCLMGL